MTGVRVKKYVYGRLQAPSLDKVEEFLTDFGMVRSERTKDRLYMRGTDPEPYLHVTELGPAKPLAFGYFARSEDDLKALAKLPGASGVENIDEPGGGKRVRLKDPNGFGIEVVFGQHLAGPLASPEYKVNWAGDKARRTELMRLPQGPAPVKCAGHGVITTTDLKATLKWYRETIGLKCSDDVYGGTKDNLIGSFNRLDNGKEYVDHHVFFAIQADRSGLNHLSYESRDIDAIMIGHNVLKAKGYRHTWGIGRHLLGSQVFDYWYDPNNVVHEHWADSDVRNEDDPPLLLSAEEGLRNQWGPAIPEEFMGHTVPFN
jgi:catechol 2,3-dioxygenase-like lactoylglutathione lyase family enzyme